VGIHNNRVIGFRGYFATRFEVPGRTKNLIVLVAGDTCVHPDFRRKGLSVLMGDMAMDAFGGTHKIFLNMTATAPSLPGYLKLGYQPIAKKAYLSQYTFPGFLRYLGAYKNRSHEGWNRFPFGTFDSVIVSDRPKSEEMAALSFSVVPHGQRIRLFKDERFFRWRFENPFKKYAFYYFRQNTKIKGYVVVGLSPNYRRGYILDYADADGESVASLLRHMIRNRHFDILSIYHFSIGDELNQIFQDLGFKAKGLVRILEKRKTGELPVLIRPVQKSYTGTEWDIEGLDIRNIKHWQITEICSDSA
jgi:hypothetical protein